MAYQLPEGILKESHGKQEYRLHVAAIAYIRGEILNGRNILHVQRPFLELYDGEHQNFTHNAQGRDKNEGFFLKRMGLRPGILDIHIWPGFHGWIDFKASGGLTRDQTQFMRKMASLGDRTGTARSVAEFRDLLISWGLKCLNMNAIEPPLSPEEKQKRYLEMMRPL